MEQSERPIIVPWDFTHVAENAIQHAVNISGTLNRDILLLHIVADKKDISSRESKLKQDCEKMGNTYGKIPRFKVVAGSIFHAIGDTAKSLKAEMIIMGTHGRVGAQKLFGSKALKVVVSSRIPFFIVQEKPTTDKINTILMPIDFRSEHKEKSRWIQYLHGNFGARFIILKKNVKDRGFRRKTLSNIKFIETYLKGNDVPYQIVTASRKQSFKKEIVHFAKEHEADLILVMATRNITWVDYVFGAPEQYILANPEHLPVMCLNPKRVQLSGGFSATGSR